MLKNLYVSAQLFREERYVQRFIENTKYTFFRNEVKHLFTTNYFQSSYYFHVMEVHYRAQISSTLTNDYSRETHWKSKRLAEVHLGLICNNVCMNVCII